VNLVERAVSNGGKLAPLAIPQGLTSGTGLMNPSIFIDDDGDILVNLRHVNYTLYHSENKQLFPSRWGPLSYLHPEKDQRLVTENYLCRLNTDLEMTDYARVEMLDLHTPMWEFVGLEDARLVQWYGEYYLIGVRRDTTTNGQGRMEFTTIEINKEKWSIKEVARTRIPAPKPDNSYCEKNWVPILNKPYHFIKWTMPTELVVADPDESICEQVFVKETPPAPSDQRGGSQVVRWGNMYIAITHEVTLFKNYLVQKDGIYRHRLVLWDEQLNFVGLSKEFSFLDARIEFAVGAAIYEGDLLISFGFQDNAAFVLRTPRLVVEGLINEALAYED
jgi:predicted GH43/DUF377 family glycosyl hydrolase